MTEVAFQKPDHEIEAILPGIVLGWRLLIRPYRPAKYSSGGIELPDEVLENEEILTYVGQVLAMGNKCFTAVTRSGIDMKEIEPKPKVGDWVIYGTYGGQKLFLKSGGTYVITNDDAISCVVRDPSIFKYYA